VKGLYEKGFGRRDIIQLFTFIDWVMILPEALERSFEQEITQYEKERDVDYVTIARSVSLDTHIDSYSALLYKSSGKWIDVPFSRGIRRCRFRESSSLRKWSKWWFD